MNESKFHVGQIVVHRLTQDRLIVVRDIACGYTYYQVRRPDYTVVDIREEELAEAEMRPDA